MPIVFFCIDIFTDCHHDLTVYVYFIVSDVSVSGSGRRVCVCAQPLTEI